MSFGYLNETSQALRWIIKGVHTAAEVYRVQHLLTRQDSSFELTLESLYQLLHSPAQAQNFYSLFKVKSFDENKHLKLAQRLESDRFHILNNF